ncbi:MAG: RNA polymerase sigma-70 factor [Cytophagales bacterium]|nr:RNA polymerase sigma-70 factor [Cytophagales bacterium]
MIKKKVPDNEFQILSRVREGSEKAFEALFDIYKDKIYAFSYKILKTKDLADDMVIEVFTKIWKGRLSIRPGLSFQAYLFRITKNHILDFLDKAAIDSRIQQQLMLSVDYYRSSTEEEIIYKEYLTLAEQVINQMPERRRQVFRLKNEQGMSYEQIAAHLGVSKNTVKSHLAAATTHLRNVFSRYPDKTAILLLTFLYDLKL